jgi:uncharacterized DUF497 family protein
MNFVWDPAKAEANYRKHGIRFEDAVEVFLGPTVSFPDERLEYGEEREITIGLVGGMNIVVVVHVERGEAVRIISARKAVRWERQLYEQELFS